MFGSGLKLPRKKKFFVVAEFALVHPPMASVLLSASVERCFVSRMRDFFSRNYYNFCLYQSVESKHILLSLASLLQSRQTDRSISLTKSASRKVRWSSCPVIWANLGTLMLVPKTRQRSIIYLNDSPNPQGAA